MIYTTLDNFYLTAEQLEDSPSRRDGVSADEEMQARVYGCELIQASGMLLRLPQVTMATGQVLLHRFYCKQSLVKRDVKVLSMACLFLATKLEETARKHREIISVFHRVERRREGRGLEPLDLYGNAYSEKKVQLVKAEKLILTQLGFILHVDHPHKDMLNYLHYLQASPSLMQVAWNLTNDSLRSTLCVRFKSKIVACGIIYTAARHLQVALPEDPPWWEVFSVELGDMCTVCREIFKLYRLKKAVYIHHAKKPGPTADSNASPAPAQHTPVISAGHSGGEPVEPGSKGPSPAALLDGKTLHPPEGAAAGRSGLDADCRPAPSDSTRHADREGSARQQARHSAHPSDRPRVAANNREEDRRDRHREHRRGNGRRDHDRAAEPDRHREAERRRDRRSDRDRDSHQPRQQDGRSRDRDRDRARPLDLEPQRSRDRDRNRDRPSTSSRDGIPASKPERDRPALDIHRDSSKRHRIGKDHDADALPRKRDAEIMRHSNSSPERVRPPTEPAIKCQWTFQHNPDGARPSRSKSSTATSSQSP